MCKSSISFEVKLGEPEYIDDNTSMISMYLRQKGGKEFTRHDKIFKFNGQVWKTVSNK